ncbi:MAG: hypothetical protein H7096_10755 [Flavobacterium sp.]|nr:hypothetical protein [Pedobacter sp.]
MTLSDQEFREEFKPLHVPASFHPENLIEDKIVFALAQISEGNSTQVIEKLEELEPGIKNEQLIQKVTEFLKDKFDKGLLNGSAKDGQNYYNLSKITNPNKGSVNR